MFLILAATLAFITALWGIARHLKDEGPSPVCTEHRCDCVGFDHDRANE